MKATRTVVRLIALNALTALATLLLCTVAPLAVGWHSQVVLSGSMRPGLSPGDLVVASPASAAGLRAGQVIVIANPARPGTLLVHRLVARNADGTLTTRGDANRMDDSTPAPADSVRGLARLRVPYVGLPILWLREGHYLAVGLALAGLVLLSIMATARR